MVLDLERYESLKSFIVNYLASTNNEVQIVNALKERHKLCICSNRRIGDVNTTLSLLHILEKRNCLSANYTKPLEHIVHLLNDPVDLSNNVQSYNATAKNEKPHRYIMCKDRNASFGSSDLTKKKRQMIHELLSEELGKSWRNLARSLTIREADIDVLNERYPTDLKSKILEMLKLFENRTEAAKWFRVLCDALKESRRTDLKTKIVNIYN